MRVNDKLVEALSALYQIHWQYLVAGGGKKQVYRIERWMDAILPPEEKREGDASYTSGRTRATTVQMTPRGGKRT
jgi:hypothetical protein